MDWLKSAADAGHALLPIIVPILVGLVKKQFAKMPKEAVPLVAIAIGAVLDSAMVYFNGGTSWGAYGAVAGLAGVGAYELKKQLFS